MEDKNYLNKKTKRKNDKNMPHYTKEDDLKYNIKNKILEKQKNFKNYKDIKIKQKEKNKELKNEEEDDNDNDNNEKENDGNEKENSEFIKEENINEENSYEDEIDDNQIDQENNKFNLSTKIKKKVIIILEGATLELGSLKKNPQIINCDDHYKIIKSMKKKLDEFRPDIVHQCLLNLFDSPLNKVGLLKVYIHTNRNILIDINPKTRMPRTFKRFSGLFTQLLLKNEIKASGTNETLMKVINSDINNIVRKNDPKILLSSKGRLIDIETYCQNLNTVGEENANICFIIGVNPKTDVDSSIKYHDDLISLSSFDLDSNIVCGKVCSSFEKIWEIL